MIQVTDILPNFKSLKEYREFLDTLVEKKADGTEIARGMDQNDKSKMQKAKVVSKEVKKNANGSASEKHYDYIDPEPEQPEMEPPQPLQPGQQVNIGNKTTDPSAFGSKTIELSVGGEKDKLEMKPKLDLRSLKNKPI
jgi:hypothetical protein